MDMKFLKRFPESKHEQIRQLMGYVSLLGISGKDLVSIGGYIERGKKREQAEYLRDIALGYKIEHIRGDDKDPRTLRRRFRLEHNGSWYVFEREYYREWKVISRKTGRRITHNPQWRDWGAWAQRRSYTSREQIELYDVLLDVHDGHLQLNF